MRSPKSSATSVDKFHSPAADSFEAEMLQARATGSTEPSTTSGTANYPPKFKHALDFAGWLKKFEGQTLFEGVAIPSREDIDRLKELRRQWKYSDEYSEVKFSFPSDVDMLKSEISFWQKMRDIVDDGDRDAFDEFMRSDC